MPASAVTACRFFFEIETPIEVERFDPQKPLYCRTFQKSDVQKHNDFDTCLSVKVQKHEENVTFSKNVSNALRKNVVFEASQQS